jgi:3-hydroxyisobutyrate dehydrogenase-like beta-hydroxyacid dehydrogenase
MVEVPGTPLKVGLFGLGNMGEAIGARLLRLGPLLAHDPAEERANEVGRRHGIELASGAEEMGDRDVVVLSLPSPAVSRTVVDTLCSTLRAGTVIIETSTINPSDAWDLGRRCGAASLRMVDAAVLSGVSQMAAGTSMLLVGGDDTDIDAVRPVLDAMTPRQRRFGPLGSGMAAKVLNNAVAHAVMVVLVEAGAMAAATGVRGRDLADLLSAPDAGLTRPLTHRFVERILAADYDGGMPTDAARKDSALALELARDAQTPLFAIQAAHTVYELAVSDGLGRLDYAAIATLWEAWTGRPMDEAPRGERP